MCIALSTLPIVATDPSAVALTFGLLGSTVAWMLLKAIEQGRRP